MREGVFSVAAPTNGQEVEIVITDFLWHDITTSVSP